ncbi:hypothetical protein [Vallitalea guaymasensis]|uniref:hypothetical protein n=1 Tax=Vallitalea guaymasensis TaxID=1185412 RepID=UPI000DE4D92C|nr:hypothetical protein [Vallitalea guaymasensis]
MSILNSNVLKKVSTKELIKELVSRDSITNYKVPEGYDFTVKCNGKRVRDKGKARIIVIR